MNYFRRKDPGTKGDTYVRSQAKELPGASTPNSGVLLSSSPVVNMRSSRRLRVGRLRPTLALAAALTFAFALAAAPAFAKQTHAFKSSFGSAGSGSGQLSEPFGVAVNETTGNVYVVDKGNDRVQYFSANGTEVKGEFNGAAAPTGALSEPSWIAIDNNPSSPSAGDVYVADNGHHVIDKFKADGTYINQITTGNGGNPLGEIYGLAIDPQGLVWVFQQSKEIDHYTNAEANVFSASCVNSRGAEPGLAVDSEDNIYRNTGNSRFNKLDSSCKELIFSVGSASEFSSAGAVDPETNDLYADQLTYVTHFNPSAEPLDAFGEGHLSEGTGIAVNSGSAEKLLYVADKGTDSVLVFGQVPLPVVTASAATSITKTGATLNGTVNPEGSAVTECKFEYGTTTSYEATTPCEGAIPADSSAHAVTGALASLTPGTTYHFRLVAATANGAEASSDGSFQTPPAVSLVTKPASAIVPTGATLNGEVNPEGVELTDCHFEYLPNESFVAFESFPADLIYAFFGTAVPCEAPNAAEIGTGVTPVAVHAGISGLSPNVAYRFRLRGTNSFGTSSGGEVTFITKTPPTVTTTTATDIARTGATLHGTLNPENADSFYRFAYVPDANYEPAAEDPYAAGGSTPLRHAGSGTSDLPIAKSVTGLQAGTTYHYALIGSNSGGSSIGADSTFTTAPAQPPSAATGAAENVTPDTATVTGIVDANGLATTYQFQLGATASYGTTVFGSAGQEKGSVEVELTMGSLQPATTYHYRLVANNADGVATGADRTFTTGMSPQGTLPPAPDLKPTPVAPPHQKPHRKHHHKRRHHKRSRR